MPEAVFDTNIIIDSLRNVDKAKLLLKQVESGSVSGYLSTIAIAELFAGKDAEDSTKRELWEGLLGLFSKIEVSEEIAKIGGEIRRRYGISTVDAIIAATAVNLRCKLLTQDVKDFSRISEITAEKPY